MPDSDPSPSHNPAPPPGAVGPSRRAVWVLGIIGVTVIVGLAAVVVWALASRSQPSTVALPRFDRFEPAWSSAMQKAGVEATFPAGPVQIEDLLATGRRPFEATFTAEEVSALMNVYVYDTEVAGQDVGVKDVAVGFPGPGVGSIEGELLSGGSSYGVKATAPLTYSAKGIASPGLTSLAVEGFSIGGSRRQQAGDALVAYLNTYLRAAPGLTVERAEITTEGLRVKGSAPAALEHPKTEGS